MRRTRIDTDPIRPGELLEMPGRILGWSAGVASGRTSARNSSFFRVTRELTRQFEEFLAVFGRFREAGKPPQQGGIFANRAEFRAEKAGTPKFEDSQT